MINLTKSTQLEATLLTLQRKWGDNIIQPLTEIDGQLKGIVTGFRPLDEALAPTCIPVGRLTEIFGQPSSGMTTFACHVIRQAQGERKYAIYIDLEGTFDPDYAARAGVILDRVLLARPESDMRALDLARDLLASGSIGIIVLDIGSIPLGQDRLYRLTTFLMHAQCALVRLETIRSSSDNYGVQPSPASLRLRFERLAWLEKHNDIIGCRSEVQVLKSRNGRGARVRLDLFFENQPFEVRP